MKNSGTGNLTLGTVTISGSSTFTITSQPSSSVLSSGATATMKVKFATATEGNYTAELVIPNNSPVGSTRLNLTGEYSNNYITINVPSSYGENQIHYWDLVPSGTGTTWESLPNLVTTESGWKGYTVSGVTGMKFGYIIMVLEEQEIKLVSSPGKWYIWYDNGWKLSQTKPNLWTSKKASLGEAFR